MNLMCGDVGYQECCLLQDGGGGGQGHGKESEPAPDPTDSESACQGDPPTPPTPRQQHKTNNDVILLTRNSYTGHSMLNLAVFTKLGLGTKPLFFVHEPTS